MRKLLFIAAALVAFTASAQADDRMRPNVSVNELSDLAGASVADGDFMFMFDTSANNWVKTSLEGFAEAVTLDGLTATAAELNLAADISAIYENVTAANVLTTAECGKMMALNSATEFASTLPSPTAGCKFKFVVKAAPSGASYTVVTASTANVLYGGPSVADVAAGSAGPFATGNDTWTFVDGVSVVGDTLDVWSDGTNWYADGSIKLQSAGTFTNAD